MTGLDSFSNPNAIEALYPFTGWEVPLAILGIVAWLVWHVLQMREEDKEYGKALDLYDEIGLDRAMHFGGGAHLHEGEAGIRTGAGGPGTTGKAEPSPPPRDTPAS
jgi:hypothetical protein